MSPPIFFIGFIGFTLAGCIALAVVWRLWLMEQRLEALDAALQVMGDALETLTLQFARLDLQTEGAALRVAPESPFPAIDAAAVPRGKGMNPNHAAPYTGCVDGRHVWSHVGHGDERCLKCGQRAQGSCQ